MKTFHIHVQYGISTLSFTIQAKSNAHAHLRADRLIKPQWVITDIIEQEQ